MGSFKHLQRGPQAPRIVRLVPQMIEKDILNLRSFRRLAASIRMIWNCVVSDSAALQVQLVGILAYDDADPAQRIKRWSDFAQLQLSAPFRFGEEKTRNGI